MKVEDQGHRRREEESGMVKVTLSCEGCGDVQTTRYHSIWRDHLLGEGHQEMARTKVKSMTLKEKKRTVVVFGVSKVKPADLLKYFGDLTFVTSIVFWVEREDFCIITFLYSRFRGAVLQTCHVVNDRKVYLRPLDDIPDVEWISICPFAAPEDESPIVKMEMDNPSQEDYSEGTSDEGSAASFNSSSGGCEGSRERSEGPPAAARRTRDVKPYPTAARLDPTLESRQSNDPVTPSVSESEVEIIKSGPKDRVLDTIDIDDSDDNDDDYDPPGIVSSETLTTDFDTGCRQEFLNSVMEDFFDVNLMPEIEWELRQYVRSHVQSMLRCLYPHCILIQYGVGSTTLLADAASLTLYLDINGATGDRYHMNQYNIRNFSLSSRIQKLEAIETYLRSQHFRNVNIANASLVNPISGKNELVFNHINNGTLGIKCRLRVSGFLGVQSWRLVNFLFKLDDRVRPLMILIRHWANCHNLTKCNQRSASNNFHPAVIHWIVLFFLIHKKILPTIDSLQRKSATALMLQGEDVSFCDDDDPQVLGWTKKYDYEQNPETQNPSATCVLELARELFLFFGDEEFIRNSVLSPSLGEYISKEDLHSNGSVLQGFEAFQKAKTFLDSKFNNQFIVQHPLKLGINMASDVCPKVFQRFQEQCRFTADCLFRLLNSENEMQNPIILLTLPHEKASTPTQADQTDNTTDRTDQMLVTDFKIRLQIRNGDEVQMWLDLFEDFNSIVWPVCFGVKLYQLDTLLSSPDGAETSFLCAFKGVVTQPDVLDSWAAWAYESHTKKEMRKKLRALFATLSVSRREKREIEKPSTTPPNKRMEKFFSFDCQVVGCGWNLGEENQNATIDLFFTNVRNSRYENGKMKFQQPLKAAYNELWTRHVLKCFGQSTSKRKAKKCRKRMEKQTKAENNRDTV